MSVWTEVVKKEDEDGITAIRKRWNGADLLTAYEYAIGASECDDVDYVAIFHGVNITPWDAPASIFKRGRLVR